MSELNREDLRKPLRRAAQRQVRANDETRPLSNATSADRGYMGGAVGQGSRGSSDAYSQARRRDDYRDAERAPRRRSIQGSFSDRQVRRGAGVEPTVRMPQKERLAENEGYAAKGKRPVRSASGSSVAGAPRQRRSVADRGVEGYRPTRRQVSDEDPVLSGTDRRGRQARTSGERFGSRLASQDARSTSSSRSVVAEPGDEFSIGNVSPDHRGQVSRWREWTTRGFAGIMALGLVIGLMFFARPSVSAVENRALTPFPTFTVEGVLDGSFFSGVSTWYADTYPLREILVSFDRWIEGFFGVQTGTMMIGGSTASDDIPDSGKENTAAASAEAAAKKQVDPPTTEAMADEIQNSIMDGLYVKDGAAYSRYYFVQESVETYASALNLAAERLDGQVKVYSILAPNNSGVMLSEGELAQLGGADQKKATEYFNSLYSDKVTLVETYDTLRSHNSEYLYFRTDHHWTALGAYYAYQSFCTTSGRNFVDLNSRKSITFEPFLGSFYGQLGLESMAANPDYVTAYYPLGTNEMTYWNEDGGEVDYHVIADVTEWAENSKYATFVAGDKPLSVIENPAITDGSTCLLVKDSFGCCFAPYLVDSYQTVYIIDFRYYSGNIVDFCKEKNVNDLIFLNNLTMATATSVGEMLLSEVQ